MSSKCYWCEDGSHPGSIPSPVGIANEPLGVCIYCHVLACGHHAERHPLRQEFKCFDCLAMTLIISATSNLNQQAKQTLVRWDPIFRSILWRIFMDIYSSYSDFLEDASSYSEWIGNISEYNLVVPEDNYQVKEIFIELNSDQKKMLAAAGQILSNVYENSENYKWSNFTSLYRDLGLQRG